MSVVSPLAVGDRVEVAPYLSLRARGARYGTVVAIALKGDEVTLTLERLPGERHTLPPFLLTRVAP